MRNTRVAASILGILLLSACGSGTKKGVAASEILPQNANNTFQCTAAPLVNEIASGTAFKVSISASNGTAPYTIATSTDTATFTTLKTVQATLTNNTSSTKVLSASVRVTDANNGVADCSYSISVLPAPAACTQVTSLMFNETAKTCTQAATSCQVTDLTAQGFKAVTTKQQCNTYCGTLSSTCNSLPDPDALVCTIVPVVPGGVYIESLAYSFEVKATKNGQPVDITVGSSTTSPVAAMNDYYGTNPSSLGTIRRIMFAKGAVPANSESTAATIMASAWMTSDPTQKCNNSATGAVTPLTIAVRKLPPLLCTMKVIAPAYRVADAPVYIQISATRAGIPTPIQIDAFNQSVAAPMIWVETDSNYAQTYSVTWPRSVIPTNSTSVDITVGANGRTDNNVPAPDFCNNDTLTQGKIAGVVFKLNKN